MINIQDIIVFAIIIFSIIMLIRRTLSSLKNIQQGNCTSCSGCMMKDGTEVCHQDKNTLAKVTLNSFQI